MQFRPIDESEQPPALPRGEKAYLIVLASGRKIHAACWTEPDAEARKANRFAVRGVARAMQPNGNPILTVDGAMIVGEGTACIEIAELISEGVVDDAKRARVMQLALRNAIDTMVSMLLLEEGF